VQLAAPQDFEFTLQNNRLYLLQTRDAKRTPWAAVRIAVDLVAEGIATPQNALERLRDITLAAVSRTHFTDERLSDQRRWLLLPVASLGVASGAVAFDAAAADRLAADGAPVVLVWAETMTDDIAAMARAAGGPDGLSWAHVARSSGRAPAREGLPRCLPRTLD
jgi:pyruvate, orthophosphate dikinase